MIQKAKAMAMTVLLAAVHIVALFGWATPAQGDPITIPSGLAPGSTYYLAFVTSGTKTTDSSNIDDYDAFESVIEMIQGTYDYQDHEVRQLAVSDHDADTAMKVLHAIAETVKSSPSTSSSGFGASEIYDALELAYAFLNATRHHAQETK